jgi:hypothetical protein
MEEVEFWVGDGVAEGKHGLDIQHFLLFLTAFFLDPL